MGAKFQFGRIAGLPIFVDVTFIFLVVLWGSNYFTSGSTTLMTMGFLIIVGLAASILVHEFAHAAVGNALGARASHIELTGFGGLCYWAGPLPPQAWRRIAISLAGPASNFVLWYLFDMIRDLDAVAQNRFVYQVVWYLAIANFYFAVYNLLPAFPLDGGKALEALLGTVLSYRMSRQIVAVLGMCVAAYFGYLGYTTGSTWMIVIALLIALENYQALMDAAHPPWHRWN